MIFIESLLLILLIIIVKNHTQKQKKYHKEKMKWVSCQRLLDTNFWGKVVDNALEI